MVQDISYYALRRCPGAAAEQWWLVARRRRDLPPALHALAVGRARVELTGEEAADALAWAERVEGWAAAEIKPLLVHPRDPRAAG